MPAKIPDGLTDDIGFKKLVEITMAGPYGYQWPEPTSRGKVEQAQMDVAKKQKNSPRDRDLLEQAVFLLTFLDTADSFKIDVDDVQWWIEQEIKKRKEQEAAAQEKLNADTDRQTSDGKAAND